MTPKFPHFLKHFFYFLTLYSQKMGVPGAIIGVLIFPVIVVAIIYFNIEADRVSRKAYSFLIPASASKALLSCLESEDSRGGDNIVRRVKIEDILMDFYKENVLDDEIVVLGKRFPASRYTSLDSVSYNNDKLTDTLERSIGKVTLRENPEVYEILSGIASNIKSCITASSHLKSRLESELKRAQKYNQELARLLEIIPEDSEMLRKEIEKLSGEAKKTRFDIEKRLKSISLTLEEQELLRQLMVDDVVIDVRLGSRTVFIAPYVALIFLLQAVALIILIGRRT